MGDGEITKIELGYRGDASLICGSGQIRARLLVRRMAIAAITGTLESKIFRPSVDLSGY